MIVKELNYAQNEIKKSNLHWLCYYNFVTDFLIYWFDDFCYHTLAS